MNEATLEARIGQVLKKVFPTFKEVKVEHQTSFSIKIGHHNIPLDSKLSGKNSVRGISDILFKIDGDNVILLELKQEDVRISQSDISQGLSYARLLDQMPPLTLISNGKDNRFYNTYTREEIKADTIDFEFIQNSIDYSFELARKDFKDAVHLLLNNDPEIFSRVINAISQEKFERNIGEIGNFEKSICLDFNIERTILKEIKALFDDGRSLVGIEGSAFSGKTFLLYQFYKHFHSNNDFFLYMDCNDHNYSIYKQLANSFSRSSGVTVNQDQIREWLNSSLNTSGKNKLYLLLDNFNNDVPTTIKEEILELIDLFSHGQHRILFTIDEINFKEIAYVPHRKYKTVIGEKSKVLNLDELDDVEYDNANNLMFEKFKLHIEHGGYYTPEYRQPRILRNLISLKNDKTLKDGQYQKIIAVPDYELFKLLSENKIYSVEIHQLMKKMAICFMDEFAMRNKNSHLNIAVFGSGAITVNTFRTKFPHDYKSLIRSSTVVLRDYSLLNLNLIYPKLPELLAYYCIPIIVKLLLKEAKKKGEDEMLRFFNALIIAVPFCDIIGTAVLLEISKYDSELFSSLFSGLRSTPPKTESISKGTKIMLHVQNLGNVNIDFQSDMEIDEGSFIDDYLPYAVLSQLASYPLANAEIEEEIPYQYHLNLLLQIASDKHILRRADISSLRNMKYYELYNWDGIGQIVNGKEGIIEPIVQSIQRCFMTFPDQMITLYSFGFQQKNFNLLYRFYLALHGLRNFGDQLISDKAKDYLKKFYTFFSDFMANYLAKNIEDRKQGEELYNLLIKLNIGEELNRIDRSE